jgi:hypothetical protein
MDQSVLTATIKACTSVSRLLELLQTNQAQLNAIHLAAAFNQAVRLQRSPKLRASDSRLLSSQLLPLLVSELRNRMALLKARAIATVLHALGSLDVRDRELLGELAGLAERRMGEAEFTSQVGCRDICCDAVLTG